jgi:hypothetical protein
MLLRRVHRCALLSRSELFVEGGGFAMVRLVCFSLAYARGFVTFQVLCIEDENLRKRVSLYALS